MEYCLHLVRDPVCIDGFTCWKHIIVLGSHYVFVHRVCPPCALMGASIANEPICILTDKAPRVCILGYWKLCFMARNFPVGFLQRFCGAIDVSVHRMFCIFVCQKISCMMSAYEFGPFHKIKKICVYRTSCLFDNQKMLDLASTPVISPYDPSVLEKCSSSVRVSKPLSDKVPALVVSTCHPTKTVGAQ